MIWRCLKEEIKSIFLEEFAVDLGKLVGDKDGENSDKDSVEKERKDARASGEERADVDIDKFFDGFVPSESGDETERGGGEGKGLRGDLLVNGFGGCFHNLFYY